MDTPVDESVIKLSLTGAALLVAIGVWVDIYANGILPATARAAVALAVFTAARLTFGRSVPLYRADPEPEPEPADPGEDPAP